MAHHKAAGTIIAIMLFDQETGDEIVSWRSFRRRYNGYKAWLIVISDFGVYLRETCALEDKICLNGSTCKEDISWWVGACASGYSMPWPSIYAAYLPLLYSARAKLCFTNLIAILKAGGRQTGISKYVVYQTSCMAGATQIW